MAHDNENGKENILYKGRIQSQFPVPGNNFTIFDSELDKQIPFPLHQHGYFESYKIPTLRRFW